jgi:aspartate racemase
MTEPAGTLVSLTSDQGGDHASPEDRFVFPLSFAQQRIWFLEQLAPGTAAYNSVTAIHLTGPLNVAALEHGMTEIVRRHEVLRTRFDLVEEQPVQIIGPPEPVVLVVNDLRGVAAADRKAEALRIAGKEARRPFDLAGGALLRALLLCLSDGEHILVVTMHHIITDGWSMKVFSRELSLFYRSYVTETPAAPPELSIQYADYAVWQREWLTGNPLEAQLSHWRRQLGEPSHVLELPADRPRPAVWSSHGARHRFGVSASLTNALKDLSRSTRCTLFMTLLAVLQLLLCRCARLPGQDRVIVGAPTAGRVRLETENLIGLFVNPVVLCTDLSGNPSFLELMQRVRGVCVGAYSHQELPFERLVEEIQPERDLSHTPLFQVMFAFQDAALPTPDFPGIAARPLEIDTGTAKYDLTLELRETPEGLRGAFEYRTDLFDAATISRMAGHFETLLESVIADPEQRVLDLALLTEAERRQILVEWNETGTGALPPKCLHQLFEEQVARTPDAVAACFGDDTLTYAQLNRDANQLAHCLRGSGVGPEVLVALCVERSLDMLVGLLAILKAGGAYLPLDPSHPRDRQAFILKDARARVLLTQAALADRVPHDAVRVICLDRDRASIAGIGDQNPVSDVTADNLAYAIYTSGSTGSPKGTLIPHQGLVNYLTWVTDAYPVAAGEGAPVHTSLAFDLTVTGLLAPLLAGRRVELLPEGPGVESLAAALQSGVDYSLVKLTPAHLELLRQQWSTAPAAVGTRAFIVGGEELSAESVAFWQAAAPNALLVNEYGPTEAVVGCCVYQVRSGETPVGSVPIGRPIANARLYVLDSQMRPVPVGVPGELYIGGAGVARGYLNQPALTAEKFVPDPFSGQQGGRLYRTGDLARYLPDGDLQFLGRLDHQVKLRGFRVELGEIESVLARHPDVMEALVVVREETPGDQRVVAYLVPHAACRITRSWSAGRDPASSVGEEEARPSTPGLRQFLTKRLPDYMVPATYVTLDALPLTPNGKVDRQRLPAPDGLRSEGERDFVAPRDLWEHRLTQIWEEVLRVRPVGVKDNFFELGGHSLLAVRLFAKIEKAWNRNLPLATLFQAPTVERLAEVLRREGWIAPWSSLVAIQPHGCRPPFYCVHGVGGNVVGYHDLARHLGPDQPVYGLQSQGLDGSPIGPRTLEEIAAHYVGEIRGFQPEGPYFLGGLSFGGIVAFEMARQFDRQGQKVALLALFDTGAPRFLPGWSERLEGHIHFLRGMGAKQRITYILDRAKKRWGQVRRNVVRGAASRFPSALPCVLYDVQSVNEQACKEYVPAIYPGQAIFRAIDRGVRDRDPKLGWGPLVAGGVEVHEVPGDHVTLLNEPHVEVLAARLRSYLGAVPAEDQRPDTL